MDLSSKDLNNIDYALSVAIKSIQKYNKFDEYDVSTVELKELQVRIQEAHDGLYDED